jgi:hypothetical protein
MKSIIKINNKLKILINYYNKKILIFILKYIIKLNI